VNAFSNSNNASDRDVLWDKTGVWSNGARSETGFVRGENQDRMGQARSPFGTIHVVSDGMGGHRGGGLAAEITVEALIDALGRETNPTALPKSLEQAFQHANHVVYERGHSNDPATDGMGATAVVLLTSGRNMLLGHVGDSRAYLFSRKKNQLRRLTKDHTRVQTMIDSGMLQPSEAETHPDASVLERAIGHRPTVKVDISRWQRLRPGDHLLLCSDGLSGYVTDKEIAAVFRNNMNPAELTDLLVALALTKGGEDNVTVQVIRYGNPSGFPLLRWVRDQLRVLPMIIAACLLTLYVALDSRNPFPGIAAFLVPTAKQNRTPQESNSDFHQQIVALHADIAELKKSVDSQNELASQFSRKMQNIDDNVTKNSSDVRKKLDGIEKISRATHEVAQKISTRKPATKIVYREKNPPASPMPAPPSEPAPVAVSPTTPSPPHSTDTAPTPVAESTKPRSADQDVTTTNTDAAQPANKGESK